VLLKLRCECPCVGEFAARIVRDLGALEDGSGSIRTGIQDRIVMRLSSPGSSAVRHVSREVCVQRGDAGTLAAGVARTSKGRHLP
jgi:hypothetical protein